MKNIILIFVLAISFNSCSKNNQEKFDQNSIFGKWNLTETYINLQWKPIQKGYTYTFNENGTFSTTRFSESPLGCASGNYELKGGTLILKFDCVGFTTGIESPEGTFVESYKFEDGALLLSPNYMNCDEGCVYKFQKGDK